VTSQVGDEFETIVDEFEGKRLNSPNDLVLDGQGGFYFTDPRYGKDGGDRELAKESVYYVTKGTKGGKATKITLATAEVTKPNGVVLSLTRRPSTSPTPRKADLRLRCEKPRSPHQPPRLRAILQRRHGGGRRGERLPHGGQGDLRLVPAGSENRGNPLPRIPGKLHLWRPRKQDSLRHGADRVLRD